MQDEHFSALKAYTRALTVALDARDSATLHHSERVVGLAVGIGRKLRLSRSALRVLAIAACYHDVGKIGIPDHILLKPGQLDSDERRRMEEHSAIGERILRATRLASADEVALGVRHHHERFDGDGYPDRLAGERIPLVARIVAVADAYDAMTAERNYQPQLPHGYALRQLNDESGAQYDPSVVAAFTGWISTREDLALAAGNEIPGGQDGIAG